MLQTRRPRIPTLLASVWLTFVSTACMADGLSTNLYSKLSQAAPNLNPAVLQKALAASSCAVANGVASPERLAVIDFSLPSSQRRLWLFDLTRGNLILRDLVAHGKNSGMESATAFSNNNGSYQSSIGLFRASESYLGRHGYSLRLDGLEPGVNDLARERAIVIHGADYVDTSWVEEFGRIGRSHGCPAVSQGVVREVVDSLKGGQLVFSYYPDQQWLASSAFLNCDAGSQVAGLMAAGEAAGG
ncbi:L,D-transpeptidase catalytic domain [Marinobacter mobilis]|uniref:L,D-transpeptidase catalytic domain n=2 Tax=Marinobacter mobilis TaxID=488533 RepID=A0A1H2SVF8_9GAMM|nr:L,D-transpeptidase catalytic domain [Marinobacter mobilis]